MTPEDEAIEHRRAQATGAILAALDGDDMMWAGPVSDRVFAALERAKDCPWCRDWTMKWFRAGAVWCDECQCEGPFSYEPFKAGEDAGFLEAIRLWNDRSRG